MKTAWWAAVALMMAGCGQGGGGDSANPHAGLDVAIKDWRGDIMKTEAACRQAKGPEGEACQQFEVTCKVESPIDETERAAGVTEKVLAAMTWTARDPAMNEQKPASATATFSRTSDGWTRKAADPVNLRTCAPA
ncbi:hypothetical protein [Phenylobacterium sp.]|uniref:hypothetical protein n=1 Tax=Phenylobacterium sp. TaxID=1871053 RepID=UPI002E32D983|nr:hypothetical protein [Phenylobacterium sp.]HEX2560892.1 hypothetical protein [Phenylobacterium sp.]